MIGRMMRQPWLIITLLCLSVVFVASVYDARREPTAKRQLRQADIALSVEELKARYSPEPWEQNGAKFYLEAMAKHRYPECTDWNNLVIAGDLEYDYGHVFTDEQRDALHAYVTANAETIALVLKAQECPLTRLPGSRYDNIYGDNTPSQSRELTRLVVCAALDAALSGDTAVMGEMMLAGLRLHEIMTEGGLVMDALTSKAICGLVFMVMEHCLYYARPPSDVIHAWLRGLDTEVYTTHRWMGEILKNDSTLDYQMFEFEGPYFEWPRRFYWQRTLLKLALEGTQSNYFIQNGYVGAMNVSIAASKENICDLGITPEIKLFDEWLSGNSRDPYGAFWRFSNDIQVVMLAGNNVAQAAAARAALASLLYLKKHGEMPDTLEVLTPAYLPLPARDPFTREKLLHYRVEDGRALFYSVGPNEKDDGGTETQRGKSILESGDIIFRLPTETTDNVSSSTLYPSVRSDRSDGSDRQT